MVEVQFEVLSWHFPRRQKENGTSIPVTDLGGSQGCEMLRLPHFLDNWLTDGGETVGLMRQPPITPTKIRGIHFC
jgi:hypothetical protein